MATIEFEVGRSESDMLIRSLNERIGPIDFEIAKTQDPDRVRVSIKSTEVTTRASIDAIRESLMEFAKQLDPKIILEPAKESMPVLKRLTDDYQKERPLEGLCILLNTHLKENTAVFAHALQSWGSKIVVVPVPYSGDPEVYDILTQSEMKVYSKTKNGRMLRMDDVQMKECIKEAMSNNRIDLILEDGCWISQWIAETGYDCKNIIASVEQTKAGVNIAKELAPRLGYPILLVGDASLKEAAESETATPEAILRMIAHALNRSMMGKRLSIVGFGPVGRGIAKLANDHGAYVTVVEKDLERTLMALNRGFNVEGLVTAIVDADILITATGQTEDLPVRKEHFRLAKDGIVLVNAGSRKEMDIEELETLAKRVEPSTRDGIKKFVVLDMREREKSIYVIADGYPINLALGEGTPTDAIDITLSLMAETAVHIAKNRGKISAGVHPVPSDIIRRISLAKLEAMGRPKAIECEPLTTRESDVEPIKGVCGQIRELLLPENSTFKNIGIITSTIEPGLKTDSHRHLVCEEAYYVLKGSGIIVIDEKKYPVKTGDLIEIPVGAYHLIENDGNEVLKLLVINSPPVIIGDLHRLEEA